MHNFEINRFSEIGGFLNLFSEFNEAEMIQSLNLPLIELSRTLHKP